MLLRHTSGAVSTIECTYEARRLPDPFPETLLEIEGQDGSIIVDAGCQMTVTSGGQARQEEIGAPLRTWTRHPWHVGQEGTYGACKHFLDCLQRGATAETSGEDSLRTYALVDAAYRAAAEGRAVQPIKPMRSAAVGQRGSSEPETTTVVLPAGEYDRVSGEPAPAFGITVSFELVAGVFDQFYELVCENAAASIRLEHDCLRFDVLTPLDGNSTSVLLYEIYANRTAFDLHLGSTYFKNFDERTRDLVRRKTVTPFAVVQNSKSRK